MGRGGTIAPIWHVTSQAPPFGDKLDLPRDWYQSAPHAMLTPVPICGRGESGKPLPPHDCRLIHSYKPNSVSANHLLIATSYRYHTRYISLLPRQPLIFVLLLSISRTPCRAVAPSPIRGLAFTFPYSTASQSRSFRVRMFGRSPSTKLRMLEEGFSLEFSFSEISPCL